MTTLDMDSQVFEFIGAVSRQRRLREEWRRVFDGIDALSRNLDEEASHSFLVNVRGLLEIISVQITDTDNVVRALMPAMRACLDDDIVVSNPTTQMREALDEFTAPGTLPEPDTLVLAAESSADEAEQPAASRDAEKPIGVQSSFADPALPWEGTADTVAPEDPSAEAAGPSAVFGALPPGLDDVEERGGELREEDMLFWLRENDEEDLAMTLPRATTVGLGDRVLHAKAGSDDDEITQIFDKGDFE